MYVLKDSMNMSVVCKAVSDALTAAGFQTFEEYTDFDSRKVPGCLAVWKISSLKTEQIGRSVNNGTVSVSADVRFDVNLMGSFGCFEDREEFADRCFDVCANLACLRRFGITSLELEEILPDIRQKRLSRKLMLNMKLCLKESADSD